MMRHTQESEATKLMCTSQYELSILYFQQRRREDQQWYAQWDSEYSSDERQVNLLRNIQRWLYAAKPQARQAKAARHAPAL
jgi:hypothetical protein